MNIGETVSKSYLVARLYNLSTMLLSCDACDSHIALLSCELTCKWQLAAQRVDCKCCRIVLFCVLVVVMMMMMVVMMMTLCLAMYLSIHLFIYFHSNPHLYIFSSIFFGK